ERGSCDACGLGGDGVCGTCDSSTGVETRHHATVNRQRATFFGFLQSCFIDCVVRDWKIRSRCTVIPLLCQKSQDCGYLSCFLRRQTLNAESIIVNPRSPTKLGHSVVSQLPLSMLPRTIVTKWWIGFSSAIG